MAKKSRRRRRSFSEKVMIVLGIIIALSMLASLIVGLGSGGSNAPLPENERFNETLVDPADSIGALDVGSGAPVAMIPVGATAPPLA